MTTLEKLKSALESTEWYVEEAIRLLYKIEVEIEENSNMKKDLSAVISMLERINR